MDKPESQFYQSRSNGWPAIILSTRRVLLEETGNALEATKHGPRRQVIFIGSLLFSPEQSDFSHREHAGVKRKQE